MRLDAVLPARVLPKLLQANPYKAEPGRELDAEIHAALFEGDASAPLPYSTDDRAAEKVKARLKAIYGYPIQTGKMNTRHTQYFARFDSGPSTSTEALGESTALAICRLAMVIRAKRDPATH